MRWKEIAVPKLSLGNYAAAEINGSGAFLTITCRGKWSRRDITLYRLIYEKNMSNAIHLIKDYLKSRVKLCENLL